MNERLAHVFERSDELIGRANQRNETQKSERLDVVRIERKVGQARIRARRLGLPAELTTKEWRDVCECFEYRCLRCDSKFRLDQLTIDHVQPLCKGGSTTVDNIQPLCQRCNALKHRRTIDYRNNG